MHYVYHIMCLCVLLHWSHAFKWGWLLMKQTRHGPSNQMSIMKHLSIHIYYFALTWALVDRTNGRGQMWCPNDAQTNAIKAEILHYCNTKVVQNHNNDA
jgi:hypothetical protein